MNETPRSGTGMTTSPREQRAAAGRARRPVEHGRPGKWPPSRSSVSPPGSWRTRPPSADRRARAGDPLGVRGVQQDRDAAECVAPGARSAVVVPVGDRDHGRAPAGLARRERLVGDDGDHVPEHVPLARWRRAACADRSRTSATGRSRAARARPRGRARPRRVRRGGPRASSSAARPPGPAAVRPRRSGTHPAAPPHRGTRRRRSRRPASPREAVDRAGAGGRRTASPERLSRQTSGLRFSPAPSEERQPPAGMLQIVPLQ